MSGEAEGKKEDCQGRCLHILREASVAYAGDVLAPGDAVLLTADAVVELNTLHREHPDVQWFVLADSLHRRSVAPGSLKRGFEVVDYPRFVQLTLEYERVCCW